MNTEANKKYIWLLIVKHNDEDLSIQAAFTTSELATNAKNELKTEYPDTSYRIVKIELDPEVDDLF